MRWLTLLLLLAAASCHAATAAGGRTVSHTPAGDFQLTGRVVDDANILPAVAEQQLSARSETLEKDTTDQLIIVTVPTLRGASIEQVGLALGRGWEVGQRKLDNGVLLLVAPNEHKVRIEVGYGLEGLLSDDRAGTIIRHMIPLFQANEPAKAIDLGESEIVGVLESNKQRSQYYRRAA